MANPLYFEQINQNFEHFMSDYDVERRIHLILKQLMVEGSLYPGVRVLEVGCGTGRISSELAATGCDLTVNDISQKLTRTVATRLGCRELPGDCAELKIEHAGFDMIVSSECIEHTPDPWKALAGMKRLLRPGGTLVLTTPNLMWRWLLEITMRIGVRKFRGTENWTSPGQAKRWLESEGFSEIVFSGCHLFPWQVPLAKKILPWFDRSGKRLYPVMINYGFRAVKATVEA